MVYILIADLEVNNGEARDFCENIEGAVFTREEYFIDKLKSLGATNRDLTEGIKVYSLRDFTEGVNDQYLDVLSDSFVSYVTLEYER